jgi:sugar phosphate isomerase/epimerase
MPFGPSVLVLHLLLYLLLPALPCRSQPVPVSSPFFVFNNGIRDTAAYQKPAQQVALAARMGFSGVEKENLDDFEPFYRAVKANRLKLFTIYTGLNLDDAKNPFDPRLEEVFRQIRGTEAMPWLYITSKQYAPSSEAGDSIAVVRIRQVADLARQYGLKVALYHHTWFWLQTPEDAIRVIGKVDRANAGIAFNLPHFLAMQFYAGQQPGEHFPALAARALPHLFAVSVNGADFPPPSGDRGKIWDSLIQPLGQGNYDTYQYLKTFWDGGFRGPVGLQCYNIREGKTIHLAKSITVWNQYKSRYGAGK